MYEDQTEDILRERMLQNMPNDLDKREGSFTHDSVAPVALELAQVYIELDRLLTLAFAVTTYGEYLDRKATEWGLTRKPALKATGQVTVFGSQGAVIQAGALFATDAGITFAATDDVEIGGSGQATVPVEAVEPGAGGNVPAGVITAIPVSLAGVTGVTNDEPTTGGADQESDDELRERLLLAIRRPATSGNKAHYIQWAMEVPGVGGVYVIPVRDGPGTVSVAIIDADRQPASQALVDIVQNYIAPPWVNEVEAETMALGGYGVSIDATQTDDTGDSVKMVYNTSGAGTITHSGLHTLLQQPGIWQARVRVKVDNIAGATDLLQVGVWNVSGAAWCKTSPNGIVDAVKTLKASDLAAAFSDVIQEFYWNGQDQVELQITRLATDTTTTVWIDRAVYHSTFSKDTGEGRAPIGARVTVESAKAVPVNVSAILTISPEYQVSEVIAQATENIRSYLKSLAFAADNDVRYVRIGQAILDTPGVLDYANLLVNSGTANVAIGVQEVAVLGEVTLT